jgi:hypothetical protein
MNRQEGPYSLAGRLSGAEILDYRRLTNLIAVIVGNHRPAGIVVQVKQLNYGCVIEIDEVAAVHHE